ncbi:MAG TPA: hypothetical protein VN654_00360 [Vicinamibacterales bacterium]|nr:hypothetical protein [Vicinamibacterales bacterium]
MLLCTPDEALQVGIRALCFDHKVQVVGHVAVRENFKTLSRASAQDLLVNDTDRFRRDEETRPVAGAKGQEILVRADVIERREMTRIFGHAGGRQQSVRLGYEIPIGPAEAGPYLPTAVRIGPAEAGPYVHKPNADRAG